MAMAGSDPLWNDFINEMLAFGLGLSRVLLMAFPQVQKKSKQHRP